MQAKKKATVASGPKFREETPKKGTRYGDAIAISHCNNYAAAHNLQQEISLLVMTLLHICSDEDRWLCYRRAG